MARIEYFYPVYAVRGAMQKGGVIFKRMNDTKFTQSNPQREFKPSDAQKANMDIFKKIIGKIKEYRSDPTLLASLQTEFRQQTTYHSFNRFLWNRAKSEL